MLDLRRRWNPDLGTREVIWGPASWSSSSGLLTADVDGSCLNNRILGVGNPREGDRRRALGRVSHGRPRGGVQDQYGFETSDLQMSQ